MEEEATKQLEADLEMQVEEEKKNLVEGEEEGNGNQRALRALEFLTQDTEPSRTALVDACNGFNELIRLAMLWNMRHYWPAGTRFAFNYYRYWVQLLLRQPGEPPVTILSRYGDYSGRTPLNGIGRDHPRPHCQGAKSGGPGAPFPFLCR